MLNVPGAISGSTCNTDQDKTVTEDKLMKMEY